MVASTAAPGSPKSLAELDWYSAVKPVLEAASGATLSPVEVAKRAKITIRRARKAKRWGANNDDTYNVVNALPLPEAHPKAGYAVTKDSDQLRMLEGMLYEEKVTKTRSESLIQQYKTMAVHAKTHAEKSLYLRMSNDKAAAIRQASDNILFLEAQIRPLVAAGVTYGTASGSTGYAV